ncbi:MAG: hypothetical protein WC897_01830 [Candidatus Gracilibacteria bacterium]
MSQILSQIRSIFTRNERLSLASVGGLLLLATFAMGLVSLTSLNDKAMKGTQLSRLENDRQELVTDGEVTDMLSLRARAIATIEAGSTHMIKPGTTDITYVMPISVVAVNK